jgi:hypothetical protein
VLLTVTVTVKRPCPLRAGFCTSPALETGLDRELSLQDVAFFLTVTVTVKKCPATS